MSKKLEDLRESLCAELEKMAKKEEMTTSDLEIIDTLTHSIKNLDKVMLGNEMIEEYGYSFGRSYDGRSYAGRSYDGRRGRDADNDGRYSEERRHDGRSYGEHYKSNSYGNISNDYDRSRDYSGHYDDKSIERFKHMMQDAIHEL